MIRCLFLLVLAFGSHALHAEPATARYAPHQLEVGRGAMTRAEQLLRRGETAAARRLAAQAALDARLAWAMTDSAYLREQAVALYSRSEALRGGVVSMQRER
jgi:hypothetical protein